MRSTRLEVDLNKFQNNINQIKKLCPNKTIMPVVKANAYGTHINHHIKTLRQFQIVAVAMVEEGIVLRNVGYEGEIFILNQPSMTEINDIEEYSLTIGISDKNFLLECIRNNNSFPVHIEIETGMNRTGVKLEELSAFMSLISKSKLKVEGIYTHLSSADFDKEYTENQISLFKKALEIVKQHVSNIKYIHINASNGILNYPLDFTTLVRPGIIIYGYEPYKGAFNHLDIKPITKYKTNITFLKKCKKGDAISYSQTYICPKDMIVATIPIGYADGFKRILSNRGFVMIHGIKVPIIGAVCMDGCMIDVSNIETKVGDEVIIWDNENITVEEIAECCNTINYEILSTISDRVPRVFIEQ
ncbi:MAG: alanine racemase [Bacilli bacterium]|nr:alanine racemase [Bacilli bacterium]